MKIYKLEQVENVTILHTNETEMKKDVLEAINDGWTLLGDSMFGYEKNYLNIATSAFEGFKKKHGDDFDFIQTKEGYKVLLSKFSRTVPENLAQEIYNEIYQPYIKQGF